MGATYFFLKVHLQALHQQSTWQRMEPMILIATSFCNYYQLLHCCTEWVSTDMALRTLCLEWHFLLQLKRYLSTPAINMARKGICSAFILTKKFFPQKSATIETASHAAPKGDECSESKLACTRTSAMCPIAISVFAKRVCLGCAHLDHMIALQ